MAMFEPQCLPTLNHKGYQMSTPSPLVQYWIRSYNGRKPLMDIGCAYGINTFMALNRNIPTIAVDPDKRHLEKLQSDLNGGQKDLLTTLEGSLPSNIDVQNESISGILVSEVMHFLRGEEIPSALQTLYSKLMPGGIVVLTALQIFMLENKDEKRVAKFFRDRDNGEKWPGITLVDEGFVSTLRNSSKQQKATFDEFGTGQPVFLHFFVLDQIVHELKQVGFEIVEAREGTHPGYPSGDSNISNANLQIVAKKSL